MLRAVLFYGGFFSFLSRVMLWWWCADYSFAVSLPLLVAFSVSAPSSFWLQASRRCGGFTGSTPPSFPGQLFNYPGLLIVAGTQHSEAEAGPAPVNDWLFHHGPLGPSRRPRDRRSLKAAGPSCSAIASAFFITWLWYRLKIAICTSSSFPNPPINGKLNGLLQYICACVLVCWKILTFGQAWGGIPASSSKLEKVHSEQTTF